MKGLCGCLKGSEKRLIRLPRDTRFHGDGADAAPLLRVESFRRGTEHPGSAFLWRLAVEGRHEL